MPDAGFFAESPEAVGIDPVGLEQLFQRAAREVRDGLLPSAQIAVARHGKIAAMRTVGTVTHEGRPARRPTTRCTSSSRPPRPAPRRPPGC